MSNNNKVPTTFKSVPSTFLGVMALLVLAGRRIALRRAAGSTARLHVRLVFFFSMIAAVPTLLVAGFAAFLFQSGVDFWFSDNSRGLMENANQLAEGYYEENQLDLSLTPPPSIWNGLAQQYLELVAPATEAPESFHLGSFITAIGCLIGRDAWFCNPHEVFPNFYTLLLGPTGQGRKTTSYRFGLGPWERFAKPFELN